MSKNFFNSQFWICGRKVLFVTREEAQKRADEINAKAGAIILKVYSDPCKYCNGWHLCKNG